MKREIFNKLSRRSASLQEPKISQKNLRKSDPPKYWKAFRETLGRGKQADMHASSGVSSAFRFPVQASTTRNMSEETKEGMGGQAEG